ncbi:MAG: GAP family protein [Gordonia sp. (in: high G+C Gram-positive bacteria)]|uniref:GAP family protein n=1 Tax=Gordonia sp. (in: high G+C Gram-positive bacteria) TaxID=84139 RepID=UPI0039E26C7D
MDPAVIGEVLPLGVAVAIAPVPIIGAILFLLSKNPRLAGPMYLLGWTVGILGLVVPAALLSSRLPHDQQANGPGLVSKLMPLAMGLIFAFFAFQSWRSVKMAGAETKEPKWMTAITQMSPGKALLVGFAVGFLNIKGGILDIRAGFTVAGHPGSVQASAIAVFTLIGISTVAIPVITYLIVGHRLDDTLESMHRWLAKHGTACVATLMTLLAAQSFAKVLELL